MEPRKFGSDRDAAVRAELGNRGVYIKVPENSSRECDQWDMLSMNQRMRKLNPDGEIGVAR